MTQIMLNFPNIPFCVNCNNDKSEKEIQQGDKKSDLINQIKDRKLISKSLIALLQAFECFRDLLLGS